MRPWWLEHLRLKSQCKHDTSITIINPTIDGFLDRSSLGESSTSWSFSNILFDSFLKMLSKFYFHKNHTIPQIVERETCSPLFKKPVEENFFELRRIFS